MVLRVALVLSLFLPVSQLVSPAVARIVQPAAAPIDPALLTTRESAWRAYFAGDAATLHAMLPPEFIGIGMDDDPFKDKAATLTEAQAFRAGGGTLVRLAFPETRAQQFGDVVVLYGRFELVLANAGKEQTFRGRLTEVFVKRDGRWLHPGWHLDVPSARLGQ